MNFTTEYWSLISAIVGGLIGALAGGIPAWLLAKRESDEILRRDKDKRYQREKELAFRVVCKLQIIVNNTILLRNHVTQSAILRRIPENQNMEPWQSLQPVVGFGDEDRIRIDPEEMAIFLSANEINFMQDIMLLAQRHSSTHVIFREYCGLRNKLLRLLPVQDKFFGPFGTSNISVEKILELKPLTIPLNNMAEGLITGTEEDLQLSKIVTTKFGPIAKKYFNDPKFPSLTFPSDDDLEEMLEIGISH